METNYYLDLQLCPLCKSVLIINDEVFLKTKRCNKKHYIIFANSNLLSFYEEKIMIKDHFVSYFPHKNKTYIHHTAHFNRKIVNTMQNEHIIYHTDGNLLFNKDIELIVSNVLLLQ